MSAVAPVRRVVGTVAPLPRANVDTDQIIPKQFLKRLERTGYGAFLFHDWRRRPDGSPDPDFVLNQPEYTGARILVTGANFGCGSSREHAAWALAEYGFGAVIAPSLADIFRSNCYQTGIVPVTLPAGDVDAFMERAIDRPGYTARVDVAAREVVGSDGFRALFVLDPFRARCLIEGMDEIAATLEHEGAIAAYEEGR